MIEGDFYSHNLDSSTEKQINCKSIIYSDGIMKTEPENAEINHLPSFTHLKSLKLIDSSNYIKTYRIVFNNGDIFEGSYSFNNMRVFTGEGTLTYHDERHPAITLIIENGYPVSGEGVLDLCGSSKVFEGIFNQEILSSSILPHSHPVCVYNRIINILWDRGNRSKFHAIMGNRRTHDYIEAIKIKEGVFKIGDLEVEYENVDTSNKEIYLKNVKTGIEYIAHEKLNFKTAKLEYDIT